MCTRVPAMISIQMRESQEIPRRLYPKKPNLSNWKPTPIQLETHALLLAKGSVESTHKVPTSHYHAKHCLLAAVLTACSHGHVPTIV